MLSKIRSWRKSSGVEKNSSFPLEEPEKKIYLAEELVEQVLESNWNTTKVRCYKIIDCCRKYHSTEINRLVEILKRQSPTYDYWVFWENELLKLCLKENIPEVVAYLRQEVFRDLSIYYSYLEVLSSQKGRN